MAADLTGLHRHQEKRLDLADMARALLHVARRHKDQRREADLRSLLARLASDRFRLAVVGQFSRGKSTLMNALVGGPYLPMGALPMTSVVTTVRYGTRLRALVRSSASGLPIEVPVSQLSQFVARQGVERARNRVSAVEVEIPAEFLRLGFEFVDTPGVGSAVGAGTAETLAYLPRADALILVTSFDSALTDAETTFLRTAGETAGRLFVVLNKSDLVSPEQAAEVEGFARTWIHENLPGLEFRTFTVSALGALSGDTSVVTPLPTENGVDELRRELTQFLTRDRGDVALTGIARALSYAAELQEGDLTIGLLIESSESSQDRVAAELETAVEQTVVTLRRQATAMGELATACVQDLFTQRSSQWMNELLEAAGTDDDTLAAAGAQWLEHRAAEVQDALTNRLADGISSMAQLARSPRATGVLLAGLRPDTLGDARAHWSAVDLPVLPTPVIGWNEPTPPARRGRRLSPAADHEENHAELRKARAARFIEQAVTAFTGLARQWCDALVDQSAARARQEAAQFLHYLGGTPDADELQAVRHVRKRIARFLESIALPVRHERRPDAEVAGAERAAMTGCAVCHDLEEVLSKLLTRYQYLLASDEATQARHAEAGGFCSVHTWQYAQIASPVGISSGNATLAAGVAGTVEKLFRHLDSPPELGRNLASLGTCPACAALADAERRAVTRLAVLRAEDMPAPMCLRHVALVLQAGCGAQVTAAITTTLASTLRRLANDMREYSLKREALRRSLITAEEADAYALALRLIAGPPTLVQPWSYPSSR